MQQYTKQGVSEYNETIQCTRYYKDPECTILHREDGPAVECVNGDKEWYIDGKRHRLDGPACEDANGEYAYYVDGKLHRTDGPAVMSGQDKYWWVDDKRHRTDGPAIEFEDGGKRWYVNNMLHRLDGPAIEDPDGQDEWWIDGQEYSSTGFYRQTKLVPKMTLVDIERALGHKFELVI